MESGSGNGLQFKQCTWVMNQQPCAAGKSNMIIHMIKGKCLSGTFAQFQSREPLKTMKFEADEQVKSGVYFGK